MASLEVIGIDDKDVAAAIMDETYARITQPAAVNAGIYLSVRTPIEATAKRGLCFAAADVATRVAHELGVYAAREIHHGRHGITSFGPPGALPAEDDLVTCLTWGQFVSPGQYNAIVGRQGNEARPGFFGRRSAIGARLKIRGDDYKQGFAPTSVRFRQVTHTDSRLAIEALHNRNNWLATTAQELVAGDYPVGKVDRSAYPTHLWRHE